MFEILIVCVNHTDIPPFCEINHWLKTLKTLNCSMWYFFLFKEYIFDLFMRYLFLYSCYMKENILFLAVITNQLYYFAVTWSEIYHTWIELIHVWFIINFSCGYFFKEKYSVLIVRPIIFTFNTFDILKSPAEQYIQ